MSNKSEWETGFQNSVHEEAHELAIANGGRFHGPNVETLSISESDFYVMMAPLLRELNMLREQVADK